MIALSLMLACVAQNKYDPTPALLAKQKVEQLMADVGVRGPFTTRSLSAYSQGTQRTGWNVQIIAANRDLYEAHVSGFANEAHIARGFIDYDNRDLARNLPIPVDSPLIFDTSDRIVSQISRRHNLGSKTIILNPDNSVELRADLLMNGRTLWTPEKSQFIVRFRPDRDVILEIDRPRNVTQANTTTPSISVEIARTKANKYLRDAVASMKKVMRSNFTDGELTGDAELVYHHAFLEKYARLAWRFPYHTIRANKEVGAGVPACLLVDATNGNSLGGAREFSYVRNMPTTIVGQYTFIDATRFHSLPDSRIEADPRYRLFLKIKGG